MIAADWQTGKNSLAEVSKKGKADVIVKPDKTTSSDYGLLKENMKNGFKKCHKEKSLLFHR